MSDGSQRSGIVRVWVVPVMTTVIAALFLMIYIDFRSVVAAVRDQGVEIKLIKASRWSYTDHQTFFTSEFIPLREEVRLHQENGVHR